MLGRRCWEQVQTTLFPASNSKAAEIRKDCLAAKRGEKEKGMKKITREEEKDEEEEKEEELTRKTNKSIEEDGQQERRKE